MYGVKSYMGTPSQARLTKPQNYETVTLASPREGFHFAAEVAIEPIK